MPEPIVFEIIFKIAGWKFDGRDEVEDPLNDALVAAELGEVTGGGAGADGCDIEVEVSDPQRGLVLIRKVLRKLQVAKSTAICCHSPVQAKFKIYDDKPFPHIKQKRKSPKRHKPGDVLQIALPNGRFAYARVITENSVAVYEKISRRPNQPPLGSRDYRFRIWVLCDMGKLPAVGTDPITNAKDADPGRFYIRDVIAGSYAIYHKGRTRSATESQCRNLDAAAAYSCENLVDQIMSGKRTKDLFKINKRTFESWRNK